MQSKIELTVGKKNLEEILNARPANSAEWNEAQNRFQFVDRLLHECLGWEHPNIEVESRDENNGISDYLLGRPVKAVLEAKRESVEFENIPQASNKIVYKLSSLIQLSKTLDAAVKQAIGYSVMRGAQIAIVCNGPQIVVFQAIVIGSSPLDGECYLFNGFDQILDKFAVVWSLLSPEGIQENKAYRELAKHRNPRVPAKASSAIPDRMIHRYRNDFQENLHTLSSLLLEQLEEDVSIKQQFYDECYVPISANNRHSLLSKNIITARYRRATDGNDKPIEAKDNSSIVTRQNRGANPDAIAARYNSRPIVVLGDVGVGKTSFFENLLYQSEKAQDQTIFVHLNLGISANLTDDLKQYVLKQLPASILEASGINIEADSFVDAIYQLELDRFDEGVHGKWKTRNTHKYNSKKMKYKGGLVDDKEGHLIKSISHIVNGMNRDLVVFIDNADQRTFEDQQQAFLIAQELSAKSSALVFVALRPSTFHRSKLTGALSGYQNRILTISPPPADEVLLKRITFAVRVAEGKAAPQSLQGIMLHTGSMVTFLKVLIRAIRSDNDIRRFLNNITGGNTRLIIELISSFCGSPNVDARKIVNIEEEKGNYVIPMHEFTKHALLGEYSYYNQISSVVACNLFDVMSPDPREHFLKSAIVAYLTAPHGIRKNDGFLSGKEIFAEMTAIGFGEDQISMALKTLSERRLIETPFSYYREIDKVDEKESIELDYRATSIGIYHIQHWAGQFGYLDAMSIDTPVMDDDARRDIFSMAQSFQIADRFQKTDKFRSYLLDQWNNSNITIPYLDFGRILAGGEKSFASVDKAIMKLGLKRKYIEKSSEP